MAPRYGVASLADLLPSVLAALGAPGDDVLGLAAGPLAGVRRVVVLLVDGLGSQLLPLAAPVAPVLTGALAGRHGRLTTLTCGVPSTTPTSLVSLGTGRPPGAHGVVGFSVAIPDTGRIMTHVSWDTDIDPRAWQPLPTQFDRAAGLGIATSVVSAPQFAGSGLTVAAYGAAAHRAATGVAPIVAAVGAGLAQGRRSLVYAYHPDLDRAGHLSGPGSTRWLAEAAVADELIAGIAATLPTDAALLVTADHGGLAVDEADKFDVDASPALSAGTRLITGEARMRYVHAADGAQPDVLAAWRSTLGQAALVVTRDEAIAAGWFGPTSRAAAARIGDVVAAGVGRTCLVRATAEPFESTFRGYHGSLTAAEMTVPLLVLRPGEVVVPHG